MEGSIQILSPSSDQTHIVTTVGKKRRARKGVACQRAIKKLQGSTHLLLPKASFRRLVNEITSTISSDIRYTNCAIPALQEAAETYITEILHAANEQSTHSGRKTILAKDIKIVMKSFSKKM
jgi:histone H3/H4